MQNRCGPAAVTGDDPCQSTACFSSGKGQGSPPLHKVASICGFLPELPDDASYQPSPVNILGIYGANDDVVPSFLADHALDEMKAKSHQLTARETQQGHEISPENLQDLSDFFNEPA